MSDREAFEKWFAKECPAFRETAFTGAVKAQIKKAWDAAIQHCMQGEPDGYRWIGPRGTLVYSVENPFRNNSAEHQAKMNVTPLFTHANPEITELKRDAISEDLIDAVTLAMQKSWALGQTYWRQADSDSYSENKRSDSTQDKYLALVDEIRTKLSGESV
jgi:hypothetical protein